MQKRLIQVTAAALLFASLAVPALAQGNGRGNGRGDDRGDRGREFGQFVASLAREKRADKEEQKDEKKDLKKERREKALVMTQCLKDAESAHNAAVNIANDTRWDARSAAGLVYGKAFDAAWQKLMDDRSAARAAYRASAKDDAAWNAYLAAKAKANDDWQAAKQAARTAKDASRAAAQTAWETAKVKADADFKSAKDKCIVDAQVNPDVTAPAAVTNLSLSGATASSITLNWTAPGDDAAAGTAAAYDIRYSTAAIVTAADFAAATQVTGEPVPAVSGTAQTMSVTNLVAGTTHFFVMKAQDEALNVSAMSNVPSLATAAAQ